MARTNADAMEMVESQTTTRGQASQDGVSTQEPGCFLCSPGGIRALIHGKSQAQQAISSRNSAPSEGPAPTDALTQRVVAVQAKLADIASSLQIRETLETDLYPDLWLEDNNSSWRRTAKADKLLFYQVCRDIFVTEPSITLEKVEKLERSVTELHSHTLNNSDKWADSECKADPNGLFGDWGFAKAAAGRDGAEQGKTPK
jgi:hypothetical protein